MKYKESLKLIKHALKHPELYDEKELHYLREQKKKLKKAKKRHQLFHDCKTDNSDS